MTKIPVLVTGIGGAGNGEQILKALRLANELDLHIIGTDMTEYTAGKRLVHAFYAVPPANDPTYGDELAAIIRDNGVRFLFHGSEPELKYLSENRETITKLGVSMYLNSKSLISLCMNKQATYEKLDELGIAVPKYLKINSAEDLKKIDFFPAVLKPNTASGGSCNVYVARDAEEVLMLGLYLLKIGVDLVAQRYVGSPDDEYTIGVNSDSSGNVLGSIAIKRVINNVVSTRLKAPRLDGSGMCVISSGFSQGIVCHAPELQSQAEKIAELLNSSGPLNIQCRWVEEKLQLMEINPRLSGTTSLRAIAGYNEPMMFIRSCIDGTAWSHDYQNKIILRGLEETEVAVLPAPAQSTSPASAGKPSGTTRGSQSLMAKSNTLPA